VNIWVTFNEPHEICEYGYADGMFAPALTRPGVADYLCGHTILRAHAKAYRLYKNKFAFQGGKSLKNSQGIGRVEKEEKDAGLLELEPWI